MCGLVIFDKIDALSIFHMGSVEILPLLHYFLTFNMTDALLAHLDSYEMRFSPTLQDGWLHLSEFVTRKWYITHQALERALVAVDTKTSQNSLRTVKKIEK